MFKPLGSLLLCVGLLALLSIPGSADARRWGSKTEQRAETAAFQDSDIAAASNTRFSADNDLVGTEIADLGPVPGGDEFEVRFIFDAVGTVPDLGDLLITVFVSTDLSDAYVVDYDDPAATPAANPGGGEVNNSIEYRAVAEAFGDTDVRVELDSRFDAGVKFIDWDVTVIDVHPSGTTVEVFMDSNSQQSGEGDVTATVLVKQNSAVVTDIEAL